MVLSDTMWEQRGLINKLPGTACGSHGAKATFSAVTSHIITNGTVQMVVLDLTPLPNSVKFVAVTAVAIVFYSAPLPRIVR